MAAMTDYLEGKLIDQLFRGQAYSFPGTLYFALFTTTPTDSTAGTEVSGTGTAYARVSKTSNTTNFTAAGTNGTTSNATAITFPTPSGSNWGTVVGMGIFDASTSGNLLFYGALTSSKTINAGDAAPTWAIGAFTCQIDT